MAVTCHFAYIQIAKSRLAPESRTPNPIDLAAYLGCCGRHKLKEYFTLDESLYFLNKEVAKQEQINLNDLLIFASQGKIQPCFYYAGDLLWREEREKYNYMKGYLERGFQGYLYIENLGERLLDCYKNNGVEFFSIKFAIIYEELKPTSIPTGTTVVLYDDFFHDSQMQEKYNQLSLEQKAEDNLFAFSFLEIGPACIFFENVYFHKRELLKLRSMNTSEDNEVEILKKRISELESLLASALRKTNTIKNINTDELTPDQEIPNTRTRGTVLKIIAILADMADLPDEPYTAFNMMEAHADSKGLKIPSKTPVADWLTKARDSNY